MSNDATQELERHRARIDEYDDELLDVLVKRADAVRALWVYKEAHGIPERDEARERALRQRLLERAERLGLDREAVARVLETIVGQRLFR